MTADACRGKQEIPERANHAMGQKLRISLKPKDFLKYKDSLRISLNPKDSLRISLKSKDLLRISLKHKDFLKYKHLLRIS